MKVLVTAASRHGATQEIAEAIGRTLNGEGVTASVAAIEDVGDPSEYDAVVLGSAVYMGALAGLGDEIRRVSRLRAVFPADMAVLQRRDR